jgi:hypothetical protein
VRENVESAAQQAVQLHIRDPKEHSIEVNGNMKYLHHSHKSSLSEKKRDIERNGINVWMGGGRG